MRLRWLELTNVRRFGGQKAKLGPFGDGLTTITAENEAGKSTFFDALHALFFVAHGSSSQEVKALQPYSGGGVSVAAIVEIDGSEFRIEKTFVVQKSAKIIDCATGQILKQQGDAEAWIEENINKANKGPAGLLWVRQGATHVDPEGKDKDASNVAARRDLMSSVRGQIDAVTGGRRMDMIVESCRKELDALATKGLKAKAGSPWKDVEDKISTLLENKERYQKDVAVLSQALGIKRRAKQRLGELQDPAKRDERAQQLLQANELLEKAEVYQLNVLDADKELQLIKARRDRLILQIKDITAAQHRRKELENDIFSKQSDVATQTAAQRDAHRSLSEAQHFIDEKVSERRALTTSMTVARDRERVRLKWDRLKAIADLVQQCAAPQAKLSDAQIVLNGPEVTQVELDYFTDLGLRISVAQELRRAQFASVLVYPSEAATAEIDGDAVEQDKEILIDRPLTLNLYGFGEIRLKPAVGSGQGIEDPKLLQAESDAAYNRLGLTDARHARDLFTARQRALNDQSVAIAQLRGLAPDGVSSLNAEYEDLCVELGHSNNDPLPDHVNPQSAVLTAVDIEGKIATLDDDLDALRSGIKDLQKVATFADGQVAQASGVLKHLQQEQAALIMPENEDFDLSGFEKNRDDEVVKEVVAQGVLKGLQDHAPNLEVAQATAKRLRSAEHGDREEINKLERELARVDGAIETQSEAAVEEKLAETTDQLEKFVARSKRYEMQAKALKMLIEHLDNARKDAQETYFEPIRNTLRPLLAQLHSGAEFELDPEKMLVGKIIRNGVEDDVNVLSGGAYEQVMILTRLAFAKLFAKQGRHVPVILDDALVHTDDERISMMFNMLSQAASDQQIIVLSCRTRAFSDLGGTRAFIEVEPV